jgi:predicted component of type VI protein secretion system
LTAAELMEFTRYLELGRRFGLHELTGFFAALATTPEMVAPSAWLPEVLPPESLGSLAAVEGARAGHAPLARRAKSCPGAATGKDRPQRPVPVRQRQEVQALLPELSPELSV